jgi:RNA polymerase sigma-70 factor (ECF subfamily)
VTDPDRPQNSEEWLAQRFQEARPRLKALAGRMLGAGGEAEDAVQEAWLRLARADAASIENLGGWLTTVVARVCLDQLRKRKVRGEEELQEESLDAEALPQPPSPEMEAVLAESVEQALLLVLDRLGPAERVAFVLHDLFEIPFAEVAEILGRSEENARQLASRARRRVRLGRNAGEGGGADRAVVEAFLAASRQGDFTALLRLLDPAVVLRADAVAVQVAAANRSKGAPQFAPELLGAQTVAETLNGKAQGLQLMLVDGAPGAAWVLEGKPRVAFSFSVRGGKVVAIEVTMDPAALKDMEVLTLE